MNGGCRGRRSQNISRFDRRLEIARSGVNGASQRRVNVLTVESRHTFSLDFCPRFPLEGRRSKSEQRFVSAFRARDSLVILLILLLLLRQSLCVRIAELIVCVARRGLHCGTRCLGRDRSCVLDVILLFRLR